MKYIVCIIFIISLVFISKQHLSANQGNPHGDINYDCIVCHSPESWQFKEDGSTFDHSQTGFPLTGRHKKTNCRSCHENLIFNYIGTACLDCHTDIHKNELGVNCEECHTTQNWENRQEILKVHNLTQFPLIGVHAVVECEACHMNQQRNEFKNTPVNCEYCHQNLYKESVNPNHQLAQFKLDCISCHQPLPTTWKAVKWLHPKSFELKGAHKRSDCIECHENVFKGTSSECISCHLGDYQSAIFPNHGQSGYPEDCLICHNETVWSPAEFNHNNTQFTLQGAHLYIDCIQCHADGYTNIPTDCWSCHENDYNTVSDPNHMTNNFNHDCTVCHTASAWSPAFFDHNNTNFPLTGAHLTLNCIDCHSNGYTGTPTDCWSCHETDYNGVINPSHITNNFNHDCTICHNTSAWLPAFFDHSNTDFPLTGTHLTLDCSECHSNGYSDTPTDCFSCHEANYNNTTNPNHLAAGFPTDCESCHNTSNWNQTTWNHDNQYFPIYSGKHDQEWTTCDECHVDLNDFTVFECIFCHPHDNQTQVDLDHSEVPNYVYASWACYDCHPDGTSKNIFKMELKKAH
jgi:hypothetical protein